MNVLHIIDDEKFIKFCHNTFEIDFLDNYYLPSGEISLVFLKENKIELIFVHYLKNAEVEFFYNNEIKIPKVWMFWGADGFSLPLFYGNFLDSDSKRAYTAIQRNSGFAEYIKHKIKILFKDHWNNSEAVKRKVAVINQMDYIVPIVPQDYDLLNEKYDFVPKRHHFNYVTDLLGDINKANKGNIILGNSATISNNHLSVLKMINETDLGSRKVFIPLNYGDEKYKEYILDFIKRLNNKNIIPLNDFMPYKEYQSIISTCDIMIMNHHRQQALGNIILGLLSGCTIFMNEKSSLYSFLKCKSFEIKNINELSKIPVLSLKEKEHNASLAKKVFGKETQLESVKELLNVYR